MDLVASDEGGMRFQGLAVVLAKLRWPDLVACERKKDLGLDAYASAAASALGKGMGLSCSITAALDKITSDAKRAKPHFSDLKVLVFATSGKVTNLTAEKATKLKIKRPFFVVNNGGGGAYSYAMMNDTQYHTPWIDKFQHFSAPSSMAIIHVNGGNVTLDAYNPENLREDC